MVDIALPLAAILIAYAGFLHLAARGNESQVHKARRIIGKVLIGLILILGAWAIVSTIVTIFVKNPADIHF